MKRIAGRTYPELRDLYPDKDKDWLARAEENLRQYLLSSLRQYRRLCADPEAYARFKALTRSKHRSRLDEKGSVPDHS